MWYSAWEGRISMTIKKRLFVCNILIIAVTVVIAHWLACFVRS